MLHLFSGPDSFSRREALDELKAALDSDGSLATNTVTLQAAATTPAEVIATCNTAPFLGAHRLVIVEGLQAALAGAGRRGRKKAAAPEEGLGAWQALVDCVPQLPPSTTLVLVDGAFRGSSPLEEALAGHADVRRFTVPGPKDLPGWVQRRAVKLGLRIDGRAASLLAQTAGNQARRDDDESNDLWTLARELDKLAAYKGEGVITEADVQALTPVLREQKGYFLCDAVVEGRSATAAKVLNELLEQGDHPQQILATLAGRYRRLAVARDLLDRGESGAAVGRALGASGYALEKLVEQASRHPRPAIRRAYRAIVQSDFDVKQGLCGEGVALEVLVQDLAAAASVRPAAAVTRR